MSEHPKDFLRGTVHVSLLLIGTICILLTLGFLDAGMWARIGILISTGIVCIGGIIAILRCGSETEARLPAPQLSAIIVTIALGIVALSVNSERLVEGLTRPRHEKSQMYNQRGGPRTNMPHRSMMPPMSQDRTTVNRSALPTKPTIDATSPREMTPMESAPIENETTVEPKIPRAIAEEINGLLKSSDKLFKEKQSDAAAELLVDALEIADEKLPRNLSTRGKIAATLAKIEFGSGKVDEALAVVDKHITKLSDSKDSLSAAKFHSLAGTFLGNAENMKGAVARFNSALAIYEKGGGTPVDIASIKAKLAISYARMGKKKKAKNEFEATRRLLEAAGPEGKAHLEKLMSVAKEYDFE